MRIGIFGSGYVGLVTGAAFAQLGHHVVVYDNDVTKIASLRDRRVPFYEPGLAELIERNAERLDFADEPTAAAAARDVVFIAVGTPSAGDGRADLASVCRAARTIAERIDGPTVIVNKSTVPVQTADVVERIVRAAARRTDVRVVSNPEFLREGAAIHDFFHPDRIVLGCDDPWAENVMRALYAPLAAPVVVSDRRSAELIKYAANAFLATRISYINEIAAICEHTGADVDAVIEGIGLDRRIGRDYLEPGLGFGGSCLPKDVRALAATAARVAVEPTLLAAVLRVNETQLERVRSRLSYVLAGLRGRRIALLGLSFKPQTDDLRESPALALAAALAAEGASIAAHDPAATASARALLGDTVAICQDAEDALFGADAMVVATSWPDYARLEPNAVAARMRRRVVFDLRRALDGDAFAAAGFLYLAVGSPDRAYPLDAGATA